MGNIVLVLRQTGELLPGTIAAKRFPVRIPVLPVFKTRHVHQVRHFAACNYLTVKDGVEIESLKKGDLIAFVEHLNLVLKLFLSSTFVTTEFIYPASF